MFQHVFAKKSPRTGAHEWSCKFFLRPIWGKTRLVVDPATRCTAQEADDSDDSDVSDAADAGMAKSAAAIVAGMKIGEEPMGDFVGMGVTTSVATSCTSVTPMPYAMCETKTMMNMCTAVMCIKPSVLTSAISNEELIKHVEAAIAGGPMPGMSINTV